MWNPFMLILLSVLDERRGDGGVVVDETLVVPAFAQEGSERLQSVGDRPILDDRGIVRGDADLLRADFVSEVFDMISE